MKSNAALVFVAVLSSLCTVLVWVFVVESESAGGEGGGPAQAVAEGELPGVASLPTSGDAGVEELLARIEQVERRVAALEAGVASAAESYPDAAPETE